MTSLEYYIEQVEQFISALTDDIESSEGTVVTRTKLAVYQEVLEHLEEIEQEPCEDAISRQAVLDIVDSYSESKSNVEDVTQDIISDIVVLPSVNPTKTGHCKDCKWWKDSDGVYRRGSYAESKCPINRREVFEGNGYCYMYEPQERSDKE